MRNRLRCAADIRAAIAKISEAQDRLDSVYDISEGDKVIEFAIEAMQDVLIRLDEILEEERKAS